MISLQDFLRSVLENFAQIAGFLVFRTSEMRIVSLHRFFVSGSFIAKHFEGSLFATARLSKVFSWILWRFFWQMVFLSLFWIRSHRELSLVSIAFWKTMESIQETRISSSWIFWHFWLATYDEKTDFRVIKSILLKIFLKNINSKKFL